MNEGSISTSVFCCAVLGLFDSLVMLCDLAVSCSYSVSVSAQIVYCVLCTSAVYYCACTLIISFDFGVLFRSSRIVCFILPLFINVTPSRFRETKQNQTKLIICCSQYVRAAFTLQNLVSRASDVVVIEVGAALLLEEINEIAWHLCFISTFNASASVFNR